MSTTTPQPTLPPILFIGGGNMSSAIITGLITTSTYQPHDIYIVDINEQQLTNFTTKYPTITTSTTIQPHYFNTVSIIVLGTKPSHAQQVLQSIAQYLQPQKHIIVSICAGLPTQTLNQFISPQYQTQQQYHIPIIRVMPNTPALVGAGVSGICTGQFASSQHITIVKTIMGSVGLAVHVQENEMDCVTGVSGSGPAYVLAFIEALTAGGVAAGLTYPISYQLALQTVYGTAKMLIDTQQHPAILREQICSPGGTTITGLKALHEHNFNAAVMQCVLDATSRGAYLANKATAAAAVATTPQAKL